MRIDAAFAQGLVAEAVRSGADEAEVFALFRRRMSVEVKDQAPDSFTSSETSGYGLRVIRGGRLGFSSSTDPGDAARIVSNALDAARFSDPDPFLSLPGPATAPAVEISDPAVSAITKDKAAELALLIEEAARSADQRIRNVRRPSAGFSTTETIIANSRSLLQQATSTSCSGQITAVAETGGESQSGWEYSGSRRLSDVQFSGIGQAAAVKAVQMLGARRIEGRRTSVLLDPVIVTEFLGVFASSLSAESVQKGKSLLRGKLNSAVISRNLTIIDSGLVPWAAGSFPFDDEGVPVSRKTLVGEGVLLGLLHNTATGKRDGVPSTGNASRGGFSSLPSVGVTNLFIEPARKDALVPRAGIMAAMGTGLYVTEAMGIHTVNQISGDFSIGVSGLWVEGGEPRFPVKEAVIAGNLLELFGRVCCLGDDFRWYGNVGGPSLLIEGVDLSA